MHDGATRSVARPSVRRRRATASLSRRNVGAPIRRSRQARRPADAMAAGIDAASMARRCQSQAKKMEMVFSPPTEVTARQGGLGLGSQARTPFDGPDDRLPLVVPGAARPHRAVPSKHRARAKHRRVAKASRRAEPQPGLSHSEAVASAKRKRPQGRRRNRGGSCDFAQDDRRAHSPSMDGASIQRRSVAQIHASLRHRCRSSQPALIASTKLR